MRGGGNRCGVVDSFPHTLWNSYHFPFYTLSWIVFSFHANFSPYVLNKGHCVCMSFPLELC